MPSLLEKYLFSQVFTALPTVKSDFGCGVLGLMAAEELHLPSTANSMMEDWCSTL